MEILSFLVNTIIVTFPEIEKKSMAGNKKLKNKDSGKNHSKKISRRKLDSNTPKRHKKSSLDLALQAAKMGTWEWTLKTNKVRWSAHVHEIFGKSQKEFGGTYDAYLQLIYPEDKPNVVKAIEHSLACLKGYFVQHRVILSDGKLQWIEAIGNVVLNKSGQQVKLIGTVQDITDKKELEQDREEWKVRYEMVAAASGQVVYDYDIFSGNIIWSGNIQEVLGYNPSEMGDIDTWAALIHPNDRDSALRQLDESEKKNTPYSIQYRFKTKIANYVSLRDRGFYLRDNSGKAYRMLGTMHDISDITQAQEDLLQSNRFKESLENTMPGVLYVYDMRSGKNLYSNNNMIRALGYTLDEIQGMGSEFIKKVSHPEDTSRMPEWTNEAYGTIKESEYRMQTKEGEWRWFMGRDTVFQKGIDGTVTQIIGIAQDITERKESEAQLYESEQSYRALFNSVNEAIYMQNPDGTFVDVNEGACKLYGYTREEFIGKTPVFLSAEDKNNFEIVVRKIALALEGAPQLFEFWGKKKNGEIFLMEVQVTKGHYFGKEIIIATARDITDRKKIEEELKESEQRFRTLQQASFGGIGMHDNGIIIDCNQGLSDLTGYSREELINSNGVNLIAPEWRPLVIENIKAGYEKQYDVEGLHKDGTRYFLEVQAKNIPYKGRTIRVTEFRNINERKLAEQKIKEQNARLLSFTEDLKRKNEQLEEFTQIVSHNLRSPVGNILTLINFIETSEKEEEKTEYLNLLKESGATTQKTLQELHEVLNIKQNKGIAHDDISFVEVFGRVQSMLSARITEVGAILESDFGEAPTIKYPNIYMESILLNLLSNSLKYVQPNQKPVIRFKTYYDGRSMMLEASDNGLGIDLERYGHQVFKLHKTFHRHPESRGIGLFMIKNQIEAMGGEIKISSQVNRGSTIIVNFNKHILHGNEGTDYSAGG